jgi:preprotein translocase subunit SecE
MGQSEKVEKAPKASWFTGLKAEFRKIIWPDRKSLARQTAAVVAVSVVTGLVIAILDWIIQYGVNFLIGLSF